MKTTTATGLVMAVAVATTAMPETIHAQQYVAHATVSGPASVRVWVEGGDVFPHYDRVTLWVRAERDCYTSLFLVDTAGYVHVLNAGDRYGDGWIHGGRNYSYRACDLGLDRLDGRGIAYVFAVGSPVPFDYSYYGSAVHVGQFGFRVIGDPFVAGREFYTSLLPASCRWDHVGVHYTRFYVREWTRYPSYLCQGGPGLHVRIGDTCRGCAGVYASYRCNVAAPHNVIRPRARFKDARDSYRTDVVHVVPSADHHARRDAYSRPSPVMAKDARRIQDLDGARVVSTSRQLAREPQIVKTTKVAKTRDDATVMLAAKGHEKARQASLAQESREQGARKKVRQAK